MVRAVPEQVALSLLAELRPWLPHTSLALGKQGGGGEHSHMTDGITTTAPSRGASCARGKQLSWPEGCAGVTAPLRNCRRTQTTPGPAALPSSQGISL